MSETVLGADQVAATLKRLAEDASPKAIKAGIRASMTAIAKAMRAAVNSSGASPELKRQAKKTIKQRFKKIMRGKGRGTADAKVGFGVGQKKRSKQARVRKSKTFKGVGISANNIHWFVLGTQGRRLTRGSQRGPKQGHPTGKIAAVFAGLGQKALGSASSAALDAARAKIAAVMEKEATSKKK